MNNERFDLTGLMQRLSQFEKQTLLEVLLWNALRTGDYKPFIKLENKERAVELKIADLK